MKTVYAMRLWTWPALVSPPQFQHAKKKSGGVGEGGQLSRYMIVDVLNRRKEEDDGIVFERPFYFRVTRCSRHLNMVASVHSWLASLLSTWYEFWASNSDFGKHSLRSVWRWRLWFRSPLLDATPIAFGIQESLSVTGMENKKFQNSDGARK